MLDIIAYGEEVMRGRFHIQVFSGLLEGGKLCNWVVDSPTLNREGHCDSLLNYNSNPFIFCLEEARELATV